LKDSGHWFLLDDIESGEDRTSVVVGVAKDEGTGYSHCGYEAPGHEQLHLPLKNTTVKENTPPNRR
jgi:hypothetical protein